MQFQVKKRRVEVVYIDKDRLHLCEVAPKAQESALPNEVLRNEVLREWNRFFPPMPRP